MIKPPAINLNKAPKEPVIAIGEVTEQLEKLGARRRAFRLYMPLLLGIFAAVLVSAALIISIVEFPLQNPEPYLRNTNLFPLKFAEMEVQAKAAPVDLLFLGTSQTNNGFVTKTLEEKIPVKSFNFGVPSNQYEIMLAYLKLHVERYGKPKVLLLETSPTITIEKARQYRKETLLYTKLIQDRSWIPNDIKRQIYLFLYSRLATTRQFKQEFSVVRWISQLSGDYKPSVMDVPWNPEEMDRGWTPKPENPLMRTPEGHKKIMEESRKYFLDDLPPMHFGRLHDILEYCKQQEIPVVLVTWPNEQEFVSLMERSGVYQSFQQGAKETVKTYDIPWVDLNAEPIGQAGSIYSDPRHLTPEGARLYTKRLAERLAEEMPQLQKLASGKKLQP